MTTLLIVDDRMQQTANYFVTTAITTITTSTAITTITTSTAITTNDDHHDEDDNARATE